jgi:uncharacterized protein YndB with AHSA1/START domain
MAQPVHSHRFTFTTVAALNQVWASLTKREHSRHFLFGIDLISDWIPGASMELRGPGGVSMTGQVLSVERNTRLTYAIEQGLGPCRFITWDLRQCAAGTVLQLTVDELDGDSEDEVAEIWLPVMFALQSQLEMGGTQPDS